MKVPLLFGQGEPVFSFEFFLPKETSDMDRFRRTVERLRDLKPAFVTITYGAGGSSQGRTVETAGMIKKEIGLETAAHLTCISHTPAEIRKILAKIRTHGIENIVALRGDIPKDMEGGVDPNHKLKHGSDLVKLIKEEGGFAIAVAGYPETHPEAVSPEDDLARLKEKVDAGGDWIITQLFFDNSAYFDFVDRARAIGITVPIVPGIMPVSNFKQTKRFTTMCGAKIPESMLADLEAISEDKDAVAKFGIDYATRQCRELLDRGAPGIHFYTLNKSRATATILSNLKG